MSHDLPPMSEWKPFRLGDLFDIRKGKRLTAADRTEGDTPYVGASEFGNGVTDMCAAEPNAPAGCITVSYNGSVAEAFYHPHPVFACDDVNVLIPREPLSTEAALFVCTVIRLEKFRYGFGRKWVLDGMRNTKLRLPVTDDKSPDWGLMAGHMRAVREEALARIESERAALSVPADPEPVTLPDISTWGTFRLDELFEVKRGGGETPGQTTVPYVTSSARNNGVTDYRELVATYPAETLTVACDGSIGSAFWQSRPYAASSHVCVLTPREKGITEESALFVCALIRQEAFRYSFGRAWQLSAMKRTELRLPVTEDGAPDWELMARYIRSLPYSGVFAERAA